MEGFDIWGVIAIAFASVTGLLLGVAFMEIKSSWRNPSSAFANNRTEDFSMRLSAGFKPLLPLSEKLLDKGIFKASARECSIVLKERGVDAKPRSIVSYLLLIAIIASCLSWLLSGSIIFGIAVGCIVVIAVFSIGHSRYEKRCLAMREEIPEALRCMAACFRSGQSLLQTMQHTAKETPGALGKIFKSAADKLGMGEPVTSALEGMRSDKDVPELAFVAVALDIQHQSGGSIASVLDSAKESVESEIDLLRTLRVQTAQAKLSSSIVTIMPFLLIALFSLMSPDFLNPFFDSLMGMVLLSIALLMQAAGVLSVRHMLKVNMG